MIRPEVSTQDFLDTIFEGIGADETICVSRLTETAKPYQTQPRARQFRDWLDGGKTEAWYFCISTVLAQGNNPRKVRRRKEDCIACYAIVLDDIGTKIDGDRIPVAPSWKLESSPGNFQWGYLLNGTDELEKVAGFISALAEAEYTDGGAKGFTRIMRLPGSANFKGETVWRARVTYWKPSRFWDLDELIAEFGVDAVPERQQALGTAVTGGAAAADVTDDVLVWMAEQGWVAEDNGGEWVDIICPWADEHTDGNNTAGYSPLGRGGAPWRERRGFNCMHQHCDGRGYAELRDVVANAGGPDRGSHDPVPFLQGNYVVCVDGMEIIDLSARRTGENKWRLEKGEFALLHPGRVQHGLTNDGRPRTVQVATAFLEDEATRRYRRLSYAPHRAAEETFTSSGGYPYINSFVAPYHADADGPPEAFLTHLEFLLPSRAERELFMDWLAFKLQNPGERSFAVIMVAEKAYGTGRSWLRDLLGGVFGENNVKTAQLADVLGLGASATYNDWGVDSQLVVVEEAKDTISREDFYHAYETVKTTIDTRPVPIRVNPKYGKTRLTNLWCNVLVFSNHADAISLPEGDRRFAILTNPRKLKDPSYYQSLRDALFNGEAARTYHWLMARDVSGFDHVYPPMTKAKARMIEYAVGSSDEIERWVLENAPSALVSKQQIMQLCEHGRTQTTNADTVNDKMLGHLVNRMWKAAGRPRPDDTKNGLRLRAGSGVQVEVRSLRDHARWEVAEADELRDEFAKSKGEKLWGERVLPFKKKEPEDDK